MAFEKAQITEIHLKLSQMTADTNLLKDKQPQIEALKIIKARQTASMDPVINQLTRSDKNLEGKVYINWLKGVTGDVEAIEPNCTITGDPLDSDNIPYDLTMEFKKDFEIDEDNTKDLIYSTAEQEAEGILDLFRIMDEAYAKRAVAKLDAFAATNLFLQGGMTNTAGATVVPAANYNYTLFPYLAQATIKNRLNNFYIIDSGLLFQEQFLAAAGAVTNGVPIQNIYSQFNNRIAFDMWNFSAAGIDTDTLLVDANSVFFATKTRYTNTVPYQRKADQFVSKVRSPFSGNEYDLYSEYKCRVVGNYDHMVRVHRMQTKGDLLQAPISATYPSVIAFEKGA